MEEIKQDELKKEFEEKFCFPYKVGGIDYQLFDSLKVYDWIASKINEAKEQQQKSIIEKIDDEIKKYDVLLESDEIYALTELKETITPKHSG